MVDNQHQKISGYRDLSQAEIDAMNAAKAMEAQVGVMWRAIGNQVEDVDRRWLAVAKTHFQEGFSALVRAVARPDDQF